MRIAIVESTHWHTPLYLDALEDPGVRVVGLTDSAQQAGAALARRFGCEVYRDLDEPYIASRLSQHAEAFGVSSETWWKKRQYRLMAQLAGIGPAALVRETNDDRSPQGHRRR